MMPRNQFRAAARLVTEKFTLADGAPDNSAHQLCDHPALMWRNCDRDVEEAIVSHARALERPGEGGLDQRFRKRDLVAY